MKKDWKGNKTSVFKSLGASNHTKEERQNEDYYATDPIAINLLLAEEPFIGGIWEPCCGEGHMSNRLTVLGHEVISTDLVDRGFGISDIDFLKTTRAPAPNIITNPPYMFAQEFVEHALSLIPIGGKVAMFLKLTFLEGKKRRQFFKKHPPKTVYVSSSRIHCAKNGDFTKMKEQGSAVCYAWFVWEKGRNVSDTILKWIN